MALLEVTLTTTLSSRPPMVAPAHGEGVGTTRGPGSLGPYVSLPPWLRTCVLEIQEEPLLLDSGLWLGVRPPAFTGDIRGAQTRGKNSALGRALSGDNLPTAENQ